MNVVTAKSRFGLLFLLATATLLAAPKLNPVKWSLAGNSSPVSSGQTVVLRLRADIAPGYHLYSLTTPAGGPIRTALSLPDSPALELVSIAQPKPGRHTDPTLNVPVETLTGSADFLLEARIKPGTAQGSLPVAAHVRYQACSDEICLPPVDRVASTTLDIRPGLRSPAFRVPPGYQLVLGARQSSLGAAFAPVLATLDFRFLLLAFGFGIAAIFTPCVFPTIPLTVAYFLNGPQRGRTSALKQAGLFSAGIVVLFSSIGALVTLIAGPFGVVKLASSPWVNGLIAAVFLGLGLSLLGAYELALPSTLLTRADQASQRGGIAGGLLLGLTFCLTSFACVGPFLGTLLAGSVQGSTAQPLLGMVAFAAGLATPFLLLASFPALLTRLPRSGTWLSQVKRVSGFIVLAVALKYVASVDQVLQLHLLTRDRFIALWFTLFLLAALYLFGFLRLTGDGQKSEVGTIQLLSGAAMLAFAVALLPALWGGTVAGLESFIPANETAAAPAASLNSTPAAQPVWLKDDYDGALALARRENKPLLISFAGYACTNCHWMKANIFSRPEVASQLKNFVLVELYTDGTDAASVRNQSLEEKRFSTVALPYYAILDGDEKEIAHQAGITRKTDQFLAFLSKGTPGREIYALAR